jgi:glycosyltransferase involved in cell wall biosynthesis
MEEALVDVVIPVHNEERTLEASIRRLDAHLRGLPVRCRIVIASNGSTDRTGAIADEVAAGMDGVAVRHLAEPGRGRAVRSAWAASDAQVLSYMDVDLSTDLACFLPLVTPLLRREADVALGSRLAPGAAVERGCNRELLSRGYNWLLRRILRVRFSDAQCGFKAIRAECARELLPVVRDQRWFFDTELLAIAERRGLTIAEVPVRWVENLDSRVNIPRTILQDLRGILRLRLAFWGLARRD